MNIVARLWPRSLGVRLGVLLILALALAQLGLTLLLNRERNDVVEELLHSQAFSQTVTLTRLLNSRDANETTTLLDAFQSRRSCSAVGTSPPVADMNAAERQLSFTLDAMLHDNQAGASIVHIIEHADPHAACALENLLSDDDEPGEVPGRAGDRDPDHDGDRAAVLSMDVPLLDGRWLRVASAIDLSSESGNRLSLISFIVSAIAVAIVTVLVVRTQTASLRVLADASDRFGRGEEVAPLPIRGPSEVDRATAAFNTMQARLSQFMRDRIRLLASVSHDLRTPLTTLRLKAEFIDDEAVRDDLIATVDELTAICNATLEFTRAEAATEPTQTIDLAALVEGVIGEFRLADADVSASGLVPLSLAGRPVSLRRALRNLIENAVRYGKRARISLASEAGEAVLRVDDDGPGIPPDRLDDIFKPFVRLEPSRNAETGGLGLGLAIAQGIVQAHGGTLTLANRPEGGARAEIRLQLA